MKKILLLISSLLIITACATGLEDGRGSYSGEGRVASIVVNEEGNSEVDVETKDKGHMPVIVTGELNVYPGQDVKVSRNSRGFGTVTPR